MINSGREWDWMDKKTKMRSKELSFDEWYCLHEDKINIELAEIGADREMDFNSELEFEIRYQKYLNQNKDDR
tara:strand:+ start:461 stop:676 length:216 start_codon:yes stop_codon:yes gene_type:complete